MGMPDILPQMRDVSEPKQTSQYLICCLQMADGLACIEFGLQRADISSPERTTYNNNIYHLSCLSHKGSEVSDGKNLQRVQTLHELSLSIMESSGAWIKFNCMQGIHQHSQGLFRGSRS